MLSPSRYGSMLAMRYMTGRLSAGREVRARGLSSVGRLLRSLGAVTWPQGRYNRVKPMLFNAQKVMATRHLHGRTVLMGYISESLGRATGYLFGPGRTARKLAALKRNRYRSLSKADRRRFFDIASKGRRRGR